MSSTEPTDLERRGSSYLGVKITFRKLKMSEEFENDVNIDDIVEEKPVNGVFDRTTPRKLFVRLSNCNTSKIDIETQDIVTLPIYSMVSIVNYPVFNLSLLK